MSISNHGLPNYRSGLPRKPSQVFVFNEAAGPEAGYLTTVMKAPQKTWDFSFRC